jgi:UDP-N-acetylglucosamine--N-acetylmuramyl-(pentapeptide) pyrophosphoryl-undecaprenol N-acetylglucosamine transferase
MKRVLFVGGGSGGHIYPLIAVWREMKKQDPKLQALFVCTQRPEDAEYLKKEKLEARTLPLPRRSLMLAFTYLKARAGAKHILREFSPDVIFSKGGAVSVPMCLAAKRMSIPVVLHESDAVMGRANKIISKWADVVCLGLESHQPRVMSRETMGSSKLKTQDSRLVLTGNPVRPEITAGTKAEGKKITGFGDTKPVVMIYGGSQGSQALNDWTVAHLEELLAFANVIHLTGTGKKGAAPREGYFVREFAFGELPHLYAMADIAVSRAGSGTIGELAANGIPAVLVPLRGLAQDHQELNAQAARKSGGCVVVQQTEIEGKLLKTLRVTLSDKKALAAMSDAIRTLYRPDAALDITKLVREAGEKHLPEHGKIR